MAIDPITGKEIVEEGNKPEMVQIEKADWDKLNNRLDAFDLKSQQQFQPAPVAQPAGPTVDETLAAIDAEIKALDASFNLAVKDGEPISDLLHKRDALTRKYTRTEIKLRDIDPAMGEGVDVISQLSSEMARSKMPHYALVKDAMEQQLSGLPANQRMSPQIQKAAYEMAVGQNLEVIMDSEREKLLREDALKLEQTTQTGQNSRTGASGDGTIPKPKDVLGADAINALRSKNKTVDQHYQGLGYKDWPDYWEKTGKAYFGDQDED